MTPQPASRSDNLRGSVWLIADMSLNIWALSLVKAMGADYSAAQIVFLRVAVGLALILPWVWRERAAFRAVQMPGLHVLRVALSSVTLLASFYAIARVPFALFTAINFTRPILLMIMAAFLLREAISGRRWIAAGIGLIGAVIAVSPGSVTGGWGLAALCLSVTTGTLAIILTRRLKGTPEVVMMAFYTLGIGVVMAPLAATTWHPVMTADWPFLIGVGLFAQLAQLCFLKAHWLGDAGVLGPVSYTSLVLSTAAGFFLFAEVPGWPLIIGASIIVVAGVMVSRSA